MPGNADARWAISRRSLLKLGSTGTLAALALKLGSEGRPLLWPWQDMTAVHQVRASVGYWRGSGALAKPATIGFTSRVEDEPDTELPITGPLISARQILRGDPELAEDGARLTLLGMSPPDDSLDAYPELASWAIDVEFQPNHEAPFHAWRFDNGSVPSISSPSSFTVPLNVTRALEMTLSVASTSGATSSLPLLLSVGSEPMVSKLRRGVYVIALSDPRTGALPDWGQCQLGCMAPGGDGDIRQLFQGGELGLAPVPAEFPYLVLAVDRATRGEAA
jgi:hypothetical protein